MTRPEALISRLATLTSTPLPTLTPTLAPAGAVAAQPAVPEHSQPVEQHQVTG